MPYHRGHHNPQAWNFQENSMRLRPRFAAVALLALLSTAAPTALWGQFSLYTTPGSLLNEAPPTREALEEDMAEARWRVGRLRLEPSVAIEQLAYVDNVFSGSAQEPLSDVTATVSAGLRAYLAVGPKLTAAAFYLPSYVWWQDLEERRQTNQRFGAGLFGDLNRLRFELEASRWETQSFVSSEFEQLSQVNTDRAYGLAELRVARSLELFASYENRELRYPVEPIAGVNLPAFNLLDRDEEILRGGLRFRLGSRLSVALGVEESEVEFLDPASNRSISGTSPLLILRYEGPRFQLVAEAIQRDLEPLPGSTFAPFDDLTGSLRVTFELRERLALSVYGQSGLVYTLGSGSSQANQDRVGAGLDWQLGERTRLSLFAESGEDEFQSIGPGFPDRLDDYSALGLNLTIKFLRKLSLELGVANTDYDSNLPGLDRSTDRVTTRLVLGGGRWP
jgi:hypothetical protein